ESLEVKGRESTAERRPGHEIALAALGPRSDRGPENDAIRKWRPIWNCGTATLLVTIEVPVPPRIFRNFGNALDEGGGHSALRIRRHILRRQSAAGSNRQEKGTSCGTDCSIALAKATSPPSASSLPSIDTI